MIFLNIEATNAKPISDESMPDEQFVVRFNMFFNENDQTFLGVAHYYNKCISNASKDINFKTVLVI